ncbi:hypothetical protein [Streptomyces xanthophaeus]
MEYPNWDLPEELNEVLGERFDEFKIEHGSSHHAADQRRRMSRVDSTSKLVLTAVP